MRTPRTLLLAALLLVPATQAWAHAALTKSVPGSREVLAASPTQLQLRFNEKVEAKFSTVTLEDAQGRARALGIPAAAPHDPYRLDTDIAEPLAAGKYTVRYRVLSQDGHVIERSYHFTVQPADRAP